MSVTFRKPFCPSSGQNFNDVSQCVPGQAYDIRELVERFTRGERLLVNSRPVNLYECDDDGNLKNGEFDETFENVMPRIDDLVDLENYQRELNDKSKHYKEKIKKSLEKIKENKSHDATEENK